MQRSVRHRQRRAVAITAALATLALPSIADAAPSPLVLSVQDAVVQEGTSGSTTAAIEVQLSKSSGKIITVNYSTRARTASSGSDYTESAGTLTFNKRQTAQTIFVPVVADAVDEHDEQFEVRLSNPGGGAVVGDDSGVVTITDDDPDGAGATDVGVDIGYTDAAVPYPFTGEAQSLTLRVTNHGAAMASGVTARARFPSGLRFLSVDGSCQTVGTDVVCALDQLDPASTVDWDAVVSFDVPNTYVVTALVSSATPDDATTNNTKTLAVVIKNRVTDLVATVSLSQNGVDWSNDQHRYGPSVGQWAGAVRCSIDENTPGHDGCMQLGVLNRGPDPASRFQVSLTMDGLTVDGLQGPFADTAGSVPRPGSITCTPTFVCDVALERPLAAGESVHFYWDHITAAASDQDVYHIQATARDDAVRNPDGSAVDPNADVVDYDLAGLRVTGPLRPLLMWGKRIAGAAGDTEDQRGWFTLGIANTGTVKLDSRDTQFHRPAIAYVIMPAARTQLVSPVPDNCVYNSAEPETHLDPGVYWSLRCDFTKVRGGASIWTNPHSFGMPWPQWDDTCQPYVAGSTCKEGNTFLARIVQLGPGPFEYEYGTGGDFGHYIIESQDPSSLCSGDC